MLIPGTPGLFVLGGAGSRGHGKLTGEGILMVADRSWQGWGQDKRTQIASATPADLTLGQASAPPEGVIEPRFLGPLPESLL